jgi:hypothetical protein
MSRISILVYGLAMISSLTLVPNKVHAQRATKFSEDVEKFPSELQNLVKDYTKKEDEQAVKDFSAFWTDSLGIANEMKIQIVDISNALLKKTIVNTGHFVTLAKIIMLYPHDDNVKNEIETWLKGLDYYAKNERVSISKIIHFLDNTYNLFTNGTFAIFPAFQWKVSNKNFHFRFADDLSIQFFDTDLICSNQTDSIAILSTNGTYFPLEDKWTGKGGKVTWIRSQFPVDEIFATLSNYRINLSRNEYEADSVLFTNKDYFDEPAFGKLKDKISRVTKPESVVYPEFYSYTQRHKIINLFDGVNFDGGYYMMGSQFVGSGTRENPAIIEIRHKNKEFLRVESLNYVFRRQTVISNYARIRFKLESDSLYHTGLNFTYSDNVRTVTISPTEFLSTQSPMLSTYHNFSIKFGQLQWRLGQDEITFGPPVGSSLGRASFESNNYFNEEIFDILMGRDEQHPLFAVANFTNRIKSRIFNVEDFSRFVRKSVEQTRVEIMRLAMLGFVFYEFELGEVQALPKLYDAIRARGRFIDYDVIKFNSVSDGAPNARLNLNTLEMAIVGVENVSVSDSQNVFIFPANRQLTLKKNRNFAFNGVVRAGLFTFFGSGFNFDYENFKLDLSAIDSMNLDYQTNEYDFYGRRVLNKVTSTLEKITGEIIIDEADNKSGLKENETYPIFKSTKSSYVYYDDAYIFNGVYNRENFYFEIFPFTFYNINNFEYKDMNFEGIFYSADIFSPLKDTLILRPDNSLGFRRESTTEGFAVYQGRGKFYNRIDLSNRGLRGMGRISYITSNTTSDNLFFFPDSMRTQSKEFTITRQDAGIQYPNAVGKEHLVKWFPYQEQLIAYKGKEPFSMFVNQASLTGDLILEPLGLIGNGLMDMKKARLRSDHYAFNAIDFYTDKANVEFDVISTNDIAFSSKDLKAAVNFQTRLGEFNKINESIFADLNPMMYRSHLDRFTWAMDKNELTIATVGNQEAVEMEKFYVSGMIDKDSIPIGSLYYSVHAQEDSLYFFSPKAKYNLSKPNLKADSVRYISVADAIIKPLNQKVEVDAIARIVPLRESKIVANYTDKHHLIYDAYITIQSRKKYFASGTIDYVNENDSIQPIKLKEVGVTNQGNTFAKGTLLEPDKFKLSPHFGFVGDIELLATNKYWLFDGGAQPIHNHPQISSSNIKFKAQLQPDNILIPISDKPQNINNVNLITGSVITVDSIHLYPAYITGRKEYTDRTLVDAKGFMYFNNKRNRFMIGSEEKIKNPDSKGSLVSLSKDFCLLFSEGVVNIPVNLGQINNFSTGSLTHDLSDSLLTMDMVVQLNFLLNDVSLIAMANDILQQEGLPIVDLDNLLYQKHLMERLPYNEAQTALNQIRLFGAITETPKEMLSTITFADVRLRWDHVNRSFVSAGKLGIGTIGNTPINRKVNGLIEIIKRNTGDMMMIYLELAPEKYYVFYYARGAMQVSSHNPLFTEPINAMKNKDKRIKVKAGQIPYNFLVGTRRELQRARDRYNEVLGLKIDFPDESQLDEPASHVDTKEEVEVEVNKD